VIEYAVAVLLGVLVGLGELVSRYRDAPSRALRTPSALLYCSINGAASGLALSLIQVFNIPSVSQNRWVAVLLAGVGAMAFFRSSVFTRRVGDHDIGIGPISFLQVILDATDRAVDRRRASDRAQEVGAITAGLSYEKTFVALPTYCLALMQNLAEPDQKRLAESLLLLEKVTSMPDAVKVRILGLYLMNAVGFEALDGAIKSLGADIKPDPPSRP
jgi:hypothetical protein